MVGFLTGQVYLPRLDAETTNMTAAIDERVAAESGDVRRRILSAAFQLFTENGYAGTSTLAIASKAKVSKRDLYALFAKKQDMLIACISGRSARMQLPTEWAVPQSQKMLQSTLVAFSTNVLAESCHPSVVAMFRLAIAEAKRSPEVAQALEQCREANRHALADLITGAQALKLLARGSAEELAREFMTMLLGDWMMSMLLGVVSRPNRPQIERYAAEVTRKFLLLHQK
jgi:AcrR family transcriptional regulator